MIHFGSRGNEEDGTFKPAEEDHFQIGVDKFPWIAEFDHHYWLTGAISEAYRRAHELDSPAKAAESDTNVR